MKSWKFVCIGVLLLYALTALGQGAMDSLTNRLPKSRGVERMEILLQLSQMALEAHHFEEANTYAEQALLLAQKQESDLAEGRAYRVLARTYYQLHMPQKAQEIGQKALTALTNANNQVALAELYADLIFFFIEIQDQENIQHFLGLLQNLQSSVKTPNEKLQVNYWLFRSLSRLHHFSAAEEIGLNALKISDANDYNTFARFYLELAVLYLNTAQTEKAQRMLVSLETLLPQTTMLLKTAAFFSQLGSLYTSLNEPIKALNHLETSIQFAELEENWVALTNAYMRLGLLFHQLQQYENSLEYYFKALITAQENDFRNSIAVAKNNIGLVHSEMGENEKALQSLSEAVAIKQEIRDTLGYLNTLNSIGTVYFNMGDYDKALQNYMAALALPVAKQDNYLYYSFLIDAGKIFTQLGQYNKALSYLDQALSYQHSGVVNLLYKATLYENLAIIYRKKGQNEKAFDFLQKFTNLREELAQTEKSETILRLQMQNRLASQEKELEILRKEKQIHRITQSFLLIGLLLIIIMVFLIYNRYRLKNRANQQLATINKMMHKANLTLKKREVELQNKNQLLEKANQKIVANLNLAKKVQFSLLPKNMPNNEHVEFFGKLIPSENLSGDFFEIFQIDHEHIGMYILDVCGHGVPSAMITVFARDTIESINNSAQGKVVEPKEILAHLNRKMIEANFSDGFFKWYLTMAYAVYNCKSGEFTFSTAGHEHVYRIHGKNRNIEKITYNSFAVGWFEDIDFEQQTLHLAPEDRIMFITDGVIEASQGKRENQFGEERFYQSVLASVEELEKQQKASSHILEKLNDDVQQFSQNQEQDDDITMFLMQVK